MFTRILIFLLFPLFKYSNVLAQVDPFPGTWQFTYPMPQSKVQLTLKIGNPENVLYPARLEIQSPPFYGVYHLLLVRKGPTQLGISRDKGVVSEIPFSLGDGTAYFNFLFHYQKEQRGLLLERLPFKKTSTKSVLAATDSILNSELAWVVKNAPINFTRQNAWPWMDEPQLPLPGTPGYYGVLDTIHTNNAVINISFAELKRNDDDSVSVWLNGKIIRDEIDVRKKNGLEEADLQPGLNVVTLFAENFGKRPPNAGKILLKTGERRLNLDLNEPANRYNTFLAAKIFYYPGNLDSIVRTQNDQAIYTRQTLQRSSKTVGRIETRSAEITLAIWDDAVEDGDSISLNLNGKWLVQGFAVKKQKQFITARLQPGPNKMIFIADNLGSISPNTSVLEIIDGRMRKSFKIETNYDKNNKIDIFYDYDPDR